jgi:hypothetical protein
MFEWRFAGRIHANETPATMTTIVKMTAEIPLEFCYFFVTEVGTPGTPGTPTA